MRLHPNAKTTPRSGALLARRIQRERWSVSETARAFGTSARTVYKWLHRYWAEGRRGPRDRPSRPLRILHCTPEGLERAIERLRRRRWLGWRIAERLDMVLSTVAAVLRRLGLGRRPSRKKAAPARRYEWPRAGDLLHLDIEQLGRFREVGHRATSRPTRPWPRHRLGVCLRLHRRRDPPGLRRDPGQRAGSHCRGLPAPGHRLAQPSGHPCPPRDDRQRLALRLVTLCLGRQRTPAPTHQDALLHPAHQRQSGALRPDAQRFLRTYKLGGSPP